MNEREWDATTSEPYGTSASMKYKTNKKDCKILKLVVMQYSRTHFKLTILEKYSQVTIWVEKWMSNHFPIWNIECECNGICLHFMCERATECVSRLLFGCEMPLLFRRNSFFFSQLLSRSHSYTRPHTRNLYRSSLFIWALERSAEANKKTAQKFISKTFRVHTIYTLVHKYDGKLFSAKW